MKDINKPARIRQLLSRLKAIINQKETGTDTEIEMYRLLFIEYKHLTKLRGVS